MPNDWYIDTPAELEKLCQQLRNAHVIALDTEFIRERTYYARLCLIQVASDDVVACIDPLALDNIDSLLDIIYDSRITKVLHAARQDLEIFHDMRAAVPGPVFDTQIAATLLGFADQAGYATLVSALLDVELDKSHSRTDWSQRPLSGEQIRYAADDVRYLLQLYPIITEQLQQQQRQDWLHDDFVHLSDEQLYQNPPKQAWKRVSASGRLKSKQLVVLQHLAAWREEQAQKLNKPRKWLMSDDILTSIARLIPSSLEQLKKIRGLPETTLNKQGSRLLEIIKQALQTPREEWPEAKHVSKPPVDQEILTDTLMAYLRLLASQSKISPATLATRKEISKLAAGETELNILQGWRKHIAGSALLEFIHGETALKLVNGKLQAYSLQAPV